MEELDCGGTPELFDPNITTIYGVRSTQEQIITLMKDWFVGGDDLRIMSEDGADSVTWRQRGVMIHGGDAWLEEDEDFICSAKVEVAGPTDVTLRFLYTPQAQGIFQAALTELQLIWPGIRAKDQDGNVIPIAPAQVAPAEVAPRPTGNVGNTAPIHNQRNTRRSKLLQDLDKHFSEEELRTLCFELGEDYENLPAQGKAGKARELILQLGRVGRVLELIDRCRKLRPNISWEDTFDISPVVAPELLRSDSLNGEDDAPKLESCTPCERPSQEI